jgi:hypothetical protein
VTRARFVLAAVAVLGACGDNLPPRPLTYEEPRWGALRLVRSELPAPAPTSIVLDLIVGPTTLTGYAAGFNLPLDAQRVTVGSFTPGTALSPGGDPIAATAVIPTTGPLAGVLVTGQSQKAGGAGAVPTDTALPPGTVLYTIQLDLAGGATTGVVFDGTSADFALPSGGLRDRAGLTIVDRTSVGIGRLEAYVE